MTRRAERVADRIREVLADVIRSDLRDPRIGFVTVTDVRLSPDLRHARVFVSFLDPAAHEPQGTGREPAPALAALGHAAPFLRRRLAQEAGLRRTPELRFEMDDSVAGGFRIDAILEEVSPSADEPELDEPESEEHER